MDKDTGLREYRQLILIVARKNGKSTFASCLGLFLLVADGEAGPEIYSAATKKDQAKIIWREACSMIKKSPALNKKLDLRVSVIRSRFNEGTFEPLGSDSDKLDGLNVHGALIDELHALKDKNLYDVLIDGMTAREQPLCIITTTAGTVRDNIYDLKYDECERIINGYDDPAGYKDETILPIVYELDKREEWTDPTCWAKANPGLGSIKNTQTLAQKVYQAQHDALRVKNLLCKDFNIRETSGEAFFTFDQLNNETTYDMKALKPKYGIGGFDLSETTDLTCATMLFSSVMIRTSISSKCTGFQRIYWKSACMKTRSLMTSGRKKAGSGHHRGSAMITGSSCNGSLMKWSRMISICLSAATTDGVQHTWCRA